MIIMFLLRNTCKTRCASGEKRERETRKGAGFSGRRDPRDTGSSQANIIKRAVVDQQTPVSLSLSLPLTQSNHPTLGRQLRLHSHTLVQGRSRFSRHQLLLSSSSSSLSLAFPRTSRCSRCLRACERVSARDNESSLTHTQTHSLSLPLPVTPVAG